VPNSDSPAQLTPHVSGQLGRVRWQFTGRLGGVSVKPFDSLNVADYVGDNIESVGANRRAVAQSIGARHLVVMDACHGNSISLVDSVDNAVTEGIDSLITAIPGVAVAALGADCVPVLLADAKAGLVAAVHSGWMGVRDDVVGLTVERLSQLGATELVAMIGPAICGNCYPVPPDRVTAVADVVPESRATASNGQPALDLRRAIAYRLARLNVASTCVDACTAESSEYFSYRRDHITGRQSGVIMIEELA